MGKDKQVGGWVGGCAAEGRWPDGALRGHLAGRRAVFCFKHAAWSSRERGCTRASATRRRTGQLGSSRAHNRGREGGRGQCAPHPRVVIASANTTTAAQTLLMCSPCTPSAPHRTAPPPTHLQVLLDAGQREGARRRLALLGVDLVVHLTALQQPPGQGKARQGRGDHPQNKGGKGHQHIVPEPYTHGR